MKKLATLTLALTIATFAYAYHPAIIFLHDGTQKEGLVEAPKFNAKSVNFKTDGSSKAQKIKTDDIKTIRFITENDGKVEMDAVRVNVPPGNNPFIRRPLFLEVVERGPVTLYYVKIRNISSNAVYDQSFYYCKIESEKIAMFTFYDLAPGSITDPFRKTVGPQIFADNPEIVEKIRNKEKGYTHKDIVKIVREYNAVKSEK
jgi:hypothetical protein